MDNLTLDKLFNPKSVAVIGASNTPGKVGYAIVKNLIEADYSGEIIPININDKNIQGLNAFPSILKVTKPIDLAIICVPAKFVPSILKECAQKNTKSAIIITAGFGETGEEGKKLEEAMKKIIKENKMSVVGPNTLGVINTENGFNGSFSTTFPQQGNIAIVSQSGAICTAILDWARQEKVGFSKFISTGNKAFLDEANYFDYLEKDSQTKAVFVYMESVKKPSLFLKRAASLAKKKPVVLIKAGRSSEGQKAAMSHTGALSVDDDIFTVACRKANVLRMNSIEGFFDMAEMLSKIKKIKGFRIAVVTNAGGPGVIVADSASKHKFKLPSFSSKTLESVKKINPHASNPLDLIGDAKPIDYKTALKMLQDDSEIDIIYTLLTPQSMTNPERVADIIVALNKRKPIIASFMGGTAVSNPRRYLKERSIVEFETPERGIKALSRLENYYARKKIKKVFEQKTKQDSSIKKMLKGKKQLNMEESFKLIKEFGIQTPKTIFFSKKEELDFSLIEYPVALKTASGLAHKTDYGLIKANIKDKDELVNQIELMTQKSIENKIKPFFALQEMLQGQEVLLSAIEKDFGKIITYGLGGIFVEVMKDVSQKIAPINDSDIEEMLSEVKGTKLLLGYRTKKVYDIESMKKTIKQLSILVLTYPQIKEIEFNPVFLTEKGCFAVDAVIILNEESANK
ncbi:MAG TPA: acetate--CoA ligase family protein [archaeon]|nr:acetate--CoA ligase family protein [archaeon]